MKQKDQIKVEVYNAKLHKHRETLKELCRTKGKLKWELLNKNSLMVIARKGLINFYIGKDWNKPMDNLYRLYAPHDFPRYAGELEDCEVAAYQTLKLFPKEILEPKTPKNDKELLALLETAALYLGLNPREFRHKLNYERIGLKKCPADKTIEKFQELTWDFYRDYLAMQKESKAGRNHVKPMQKNHWLMSNEPYCY